MGWFSASLAMGVAFKVADTNTKFMPSALPMASQSHPRCSNQPLLLLNMTTLLPFLCGSLAATMLFTCFIWRQGRLDERLIQHIRRNSYNKGWNDCQDKKFQAE